jgi:hypothetical protein
MPACRPPRHAVGSDAESPPVLTNSKIAAISSEFDFKITPEGGDALFGKGGSAAAPTSNDED